MGTGHCRVNCKERSGLSRSVPPSPASALTKSHRKPSSLKGRRDNIRSGRPSPIGDAVATLPPRGRSKGVSRQRSLLRPPDSLQLSKVVAQVAATLLDRSFTARPSLQDAAVCTTYRHCTSYSLTRPCQCAPFRSRFDISWSYRASAESRSKVVAYVRFPPIADKSVREFGQQRVASSSASQFAGLAERSRMIGAVKASPTRPSSAHLTTAGMSIPPSNRTWT
jgi:hypothetical protein